MRSNEFEFLLSCSHSPRMTHPILYSIGYEKRSLDEFLAILKDAGVNVVIDVRETAWTRKPGFSRSSLTTGLGAVGIEYVHARFAGNPKKLRDGASTPAESLAKFRVHLTASPGIIVELDRLIDRYASTGLTVALTSFERHPDDSHRGILAEALAERTGRTVVHLATQSVHEVAGRAGTVRHVIPGAA